MRKLRSEEERASEALFYRTEPLTGRGILLADEGIALPSAIAGYDLTILSNRCDITASAAKIIGEERVILSDFKLQELPTAGYDYLLLRLPKSKRLRNHLLYGAPYLVKKGGEVVITGYNQEGVKRLFKEAEQVIGPLKEQKLLGKGLRYARFTVAESYKEEAAAAYFEKISLPISDELTVVSKPGIYGYQQVDKGSRFLIETLIEQKRALRGRVLDLGCGYGYLALMAAKIGGYTQLYATDNSITAIEATSENFQTHGIDGYLSVDDVAATLPDGSIDTLLSNPPFHQGFSTSSLLSEAFIAGCKRLLAPQGVAYFVVNRFIAIEKLAHQAGLSLEEIALNGQFKILRLTHKE